MCDPTLTPVEDTGHITLYDDCMSAPDYLVRVRRWKHVSVAFTDLDTGENVQWQRLDPSVSELFQHEVDHLDGITMFDRADGAGAVVHRAVYQANKQAFDAAVTYSIRPATAPLQ